MAAGMNVTEPASCGIGGDMFCLFYDAKTKRVHSLNGSGRAGMQTSLEQVRKDLKIPDGQPGDWPMTTVHAITVPGAAAGMVDCVEKFGSGKLSLLQILTPAIELAEQGFPVSEICAGFWKSSEQLLKASSPNGAEMLKKDPKAEGGCRAPRAGEIMKMPGLANTFRLLAEHGKKGFYEGKIADEIVQVVSDLGGRLTHEDLSSHEGKGSQDTEPISLKFSGQGVDKQGGVQLWEHPPNGQGIVALMALGMLEQLEKSGKIKTWNEHDHNSIEVLHAVIEVLHIAFADANWFVADPDIVKVPVQELISAQYLAERAKLFDPKKASKITHHGSPAHNHSDTVYFAATDAEGNGISYINSNYTGFGTSIVPKGCGFTLQNRGSNFSLEEGHANAYAPGKRPYHTIIPALLTDATDGSLHTVYGVMGGFMQPQGHVQVLLNTLVFNMSPQAALDAPRFCIGAGTPDQGEAMDLTVYLEDGIPPGTVEGLRALGHDVQQVSGFQRKLFGRGQIIRKYADDGQIIWSGGSDLRGDGAASPA